MQKETTDCFHFRLCNIKILLIIHKLNLDIKIRKSTKMNLSYSYPVIFIQYINIVLNNLCTLKFVIYIKYQSVIEIRKLEILKLLFRYVLFALKCLISENKKHLIPVIFAGLIALNSTRIFTIIPADHRCNCPDKGIFKKTKILVAKGRGGKRKYKERQEEEGEEKVDREEKWAWARGWRWQFPVITANPYFIA